MRDVLRVAVGLPMGLEGGYFVGGLGFAGQDLDASVVDSGTPPAGQPSLWCPWAPTMLDGGIGWVGDGSDSYVEWLEYLIAHFLRTWGYTLHGWLPFQGDYAEDAGTLIVRANQVEVRYQPVPKKRRRGKVVDEQKQFDEEIQRLPADERERVLELLAMMEEDTRRREDALRSVLGQLTQRMGELPGMTWDRVRLLAPEGVESLAASLAGLRDLPDLEQWLLEHGPQL
jgi:hypothetical protein